MGRLINLFLLALIVLGVVWYFNQPQNRDDAEHAKAAISDLPDKAINAAAKISNRIEDAPEKTKKALNNAKEEIKETKEEIKNNFEEAKRKDREEHQ